MKKIKILGIFGNVASFGQERSNIDVYTILNNDSRYELKVLVNDRGFHWHLQPLFEKNNIPFKKIRFPWGINKKSGVKHMLQWISDIIKNNLQFISNYLHFRPDYIHIGNDYMFKTLIVPLSLCKAKIVFRLGDRPANLMFFNKWFWHMITKQVDTFVCSSLYIQGLLNDAGRKSNYHDLVLYHSTVNRLPPPVRNTLIISAMCIMASA